MNGAESLVRSLLASGVDTCFTNPGTSEMHFVAALDRVEGMRPVLCLFEGVATGAADGYGRMAEKPAATLLHLGPGLANGIANLHNARKAGTPVVNVVGDHATWHLQYDAPLTSDIEGLARPVSHWLRLSKDSRNVAVDGAEAVAAARAAPGRIATLILPADTAWNEGGVPASPLPVAPRAKVTDAELDATVAALSAQGPHLLLIGGTALRERGLALAAGIAAKSGAAIMAPGANPRVERGGRRPVISRVPYNIDEAVKTLAPYRHVILAGAKVPVGFFGYPGKPSILIRPDAQVHELASVEKDIVDALERLADRIGAKPQFREKMPARPEIPRASQLTPETIGAVLGATLPEGVIICDESVSTGRSFFRATEAMPPHDWLQLTGGAIGLGMPLAVGAAVACPDRKVINLQADGSAMYTLQALWTGAREKLDIVTCIWSNRAYAILKGELANVGAANPGRKALDMLSLDEPALDWVRLAEGMGVEARRVDNVSNFADVLASAMVRRGPLLIEVSF